jgi:biotin operon repressor
MYRLTSPQTYKIISYFLAHPRSSQIEIADKTGTSRNLVNHVVNSLKAPGIAVQKSRGHVELSDPLRLLEVLSTQRPLSNLVVKDIRTEESEVPKVQRLVRNAAMHTGRYAFTAFSALAEHVEYYITYPTIHVYSEKAIQLADQIQNGRGDVTVQILRPDSESILQNARRMKNTMVVEPIQIVIDLFCLSGPGRDGAMKFYKEITER